MGKEKYIRIVLIVISLMLVFPESVLGESMDNTEAIINVNSADRSTKKEAEPKVRRELKEKRTFNTKHYLLEDGTMKAEVYQGNLHYLDEADHWEDIDTSLIDEADIDTSVTKVSKDIAAEAKAITNNNKAKAKAKKTIDRTGTNFRSLKVPFDTIIPKDYSKGYSVGKGADTLSFKPIKANRSIGTIDTKEKNRIHYKNVWNQTNVDLIVTNGGVKEFIYLLNEKAPRKFSFEINTKLNSELKLGQLYIEQLWMEDSKGKIKYITPTMTTEGKKNLFHIEIDTKDMTYPITVDPSIGVYIAGNDDVSVASDTPSTNLSAGPLWVGESNTSGGITSSYLAYFRFPLTGIPANAEIISSTLATRVNSIEIDPSSYLDVIPYWVTGSWNAQTVIYTTRPTHTTVSSGLVKHIIKEPTKPDYLYWDVTNMTRSAFKKEFGWTSGQDVSILLSPVQSGGSISTKRLWLASNSSIYNCPCVLNNLTVNYKTTSTNSPPTVYFENSHLPIYRSQPAAVVTWRYSDPDSDAQVKYKVYGIKNDGTQTYESGEIYNSGNFANNHYIDRLLSPGAWTFKVTAFDGTHWSNEAYREDVIVDQVDAPDTAAGVQMSEMNKIYYGGFMSTQDKVDFFKFTALATGGNHLSLKNLNAVYNYTSINLQIFNSSMQEITPLSTTISPGASVEIDFNTQAGSSYFIKIVNNTNNDGGPYKWAVTPSKDTPTNSNYTYKYDALGRLVSITYQWGFYSMGTAYVYDQNGNVIKRTSIQTELK
ncbi:DNRLRE domain-containing protein [Paenibacillus oenotherae]|uniref:DNRLRE domain-containing protein n=1 Tax=Paenibacillus oenotherae TaxID=1435645 RepID=A0ABS7DA42_9BACL|nr:DNRLRE domain-containing protein [Paenibacillus oenotherae]MBW7476808.1 DNRLRE domain-containing protein [Paenibacillus oenotherae]